MAREDESVLTDSPANSPVRGTGEKFNNRGLYRGNPWQILGGSADPDGMEKWAEHDVLQYLQLGANRIAAAGMEAVAEPLDYLGDAPPVTNTRDRAEIPEAAQGLVPGGGRAGPAQNILGQGIEDINTAKATGQQPGEQPGEEQDSDDVARDKAADVEDRVEESQRLMLLEQSLKDMVESGDLTEQAQFAVNEARANLADQMDQVQLELEEARQQLQVQDAIFDFQADQLGMDPDLAPLEEALESEGGVGLQTMQAIKDIANNASLSAAEKNEQVDLMMSRATFSEEITKGISEMVQNRDDLVKFQEMTDTELAQDMDVASFFDPQFDQVIEVDPVERFKNTFNGAVEQSQLGDTVAEMDDATFEQYLGVRDLVNQYGARSEQATQAIQRLAEKTGTSFEEWRNVLSEAKAKSDQTEAAFEASVDAKKLTPGSEAMAFAIANAGQELIQAGVDPEQVRLLANYAGLHGIIEVKSRGEAGKKGEGTIRGVGGLTEDMYEKLMGEEWTEDRGMEWELQALLLYIMRGFGGDPIEAIDFYRKTGEWGGVQSLGGEEVVDEQNLGSGTSP